MVNKVKLGNLLSLLTDYHANGAYKRLKENVELFDEPDYAVMIRTTNFEQNSFNSNLKYISEHAYNFLGKSKVKSGDIIMNKIANAGSSYLMPDLNCPVSLAMNLFLLRIDEDKANSTFVYLYLKLNEAYVKSFANGSVTKTITKEAVRNLEIELPSRSTQNYIVKVYMAYTKKLTLNQQTNQTLDKMAQTLFKSWFVDFDPVFDNVLAKADFNLANLPSAWPEALLQRATSRLQVLQDNPTLQTKLIQHNLAETENNTVLAEASQAENTHQQFPCEFEPSDEPSIGINGWIPKGWRVSKLSDLINVKHGFAYKGEFFSDEQTKHILLTPGNVSVGGGFKSAKYKYYSGPIVDEYIFKEGDVYLNMTDLSKASDTLGYPAVVPKMNGITFHHNQRLGKVIYREHKSAKKEFIYQILCSDKSRNNVLASATGTTVKHTSPTKILSLSICNSGGDIEFLFETYANSIYKKISENNLNNIELTKLRDTLLPKLISGELKIPDLETIDA